MDFQRFYKECSENIKDSILGMWKEKSPQLIEKYGDQLAEILQNNISKNIVVENMSDWESTPENVDWKSVINTNIWRGWSKENPNEIVPNKFSPYYHQYKSWNALLNENKSIVVTSGTGSGKTECFMVPLIHDLTKDQNENDERTEAVEAIFLYPLNALMEDQKKRMSDYITFSEKNLKFAVFNGSTPETEGETDFNHEIVSRNDIRSEKPNILFTNPTMLEYMLLRKQDFSLFTDKLKWIVIDETHTFKGSAGAELALLLRRVLEACGKTPSEIKFATSSATVGGDMEDDLKQFISDITGQDKDKIEVVTGQRTLPNGIDKDKAKLLLEKNFVSLDELIPEEISIEEKLKKINDCCDKGLKIRLHYFIKSLNGGLFVDPLKDRSENDLFKLLTHIGIGEDGKIDTDSLNAYYCKKCGAILGKGVLDGENKYSRDIKDLASLEDGGNVEDGDNDDSSSDDDDDNSDSSSSGGFYIGKFAEGNHGTGTNITSDHKLCECKDGKYVYRKIEINKNGKEVHYCPCCGAKGSESYNPISAFYMSANFLGRLIAPNLLGQTSPYKDKDDKIPEGLPCNGQKYITFVDSRQASAGPTIQQNLETEEVWVTSVLYKCLKDAQQNYSYLTWEQALGCLLNIEEKDNCERLWKLFDSTQSKECYALAALYRTLGKRPGESANSPENWGLITTCYPDIDNHIRNCPPEVEDLNKLITDDNLKIKLKDWKNFIKIFVDYVIRSNQSMFFQHSDYNNRYDKTWEKIDIKTVRSYRTEEGKRRPIDKHWNVGENRPTLLLCRLLGKDKYQDLNSNEKNAINGVIKALKKSLEDCNLAEVSQEINWTWDNGIKKYDGWQQSRDKNWQQDDGKYMNLSRIAFKLYDDKVMFDDYLNIPIDTTFKGYSPYQGETGLYNTICVEKEWGQISIDQDLSSKAWFDQNRGDISHKWTTKLGRILDCIKKENENTLYFQAEHTAQVARDLIKTNTRDFKDGKINIMACSTTMEMGVDLGDLELVVMNNVPPHPANYKQRAGRAGRGDQNRSACLTICGNDAVGEATMQNPLGALINRPILPPKIGLREVSANLVQRHINSLLFKAFAKHASFGGDEDDKGLKLIKFFSTYKLNSERNTSNNNKSYSVIKAKRTTVFPCDYESIIDAQIHDSSPYNNFCAALDCWIKDETYKLEKKEIASTDVIKQINSLIRGTVLDGRDPKGLIQETKAAINQIAENIDSELNDIVKIWDDKKHLDRAGEHPLRNSGGVRLYWQFVSILDRSLMTYFSTHQFTPNANMPVGIVEMLIEERGSSWSRTENPQRDLRTALNEYAPGNLVFVNGTSYRMGGVKWNRRRPTQIINHCDKNHTWLGFGNCPQCGGSAIGWNKYGEKLEFITPTGYYPSNDVSRITKKEASTANIGVELIGVSDWASNNFNKLYLYRTNLNQHNSHILYFDEGQGYGYHICKECGYAIPALIGDDEKTITTRMNIKDNDDYYHNYRFKCEIDNNEPLKTILKNVVLGGTIQTDFCEIALLDIGNMGQIEQMVVSEESKKIGNTLGILLCNGLSQKMGFDRPEIDFVTRAQNGKLSICVFDVAKGGSGHSKLLPSRISEILDDARELLSNKDISVEHILDRQSMRYVEHIDITKTKEWLDQEYKNRDIKPRGIPQEAKSCHYETLKNKIINAQGGVKLYVDASRIDKWNYRDPESQASWKTARNEIRPKGNDKFDLVGFNAPTQISVEQRNLLQKVEDWAILKTCEGNKEYKPLAKIGDKLYVTAEESSTLLDENWADGVVWEIDSNEEISDKNWAIQPSEWMKKVILEKPLKIWSKDLLKTLIEKGEWEDKWTEFVDKVQNTRLTIEYTDRYLTSQLGMIITAQMIAQILDATSCDDFNIKITINGDDISSSAISIYDEIRKNTYRYKPKGVLTRNINSAEKGLYMKDLYASWKDKLTIISKSSKEMPHYRCLKISSSNGEELYIMPDGGLAHGWGFDSDVANEYYGPDRGIEDNIPIYAFLDEILFYIERASGKKE